MNEDHLATLIRAGRELRLCELRYRKAVARDAVISRIVEPYGLSTGKQDILVRCYQLEPEDGWRQFMVHKIQDVQLLDRPYRPRRNVTIADAEVEYEYSTSPHWTTERESYRDLVCDALADGTVNQEELAFIKDFIAIMELTVEDIRFVHASLYHRCLGTILDDGFVADEEIKEIRFLHRVFERLGWSVGQ